MTKAELEKDVEILQDKLGDFARLLTERSHTIESQDKEIKRLGEKCNQLTKDKSDLEEKHRELTNQIIELKKIKTIVVTNKDYEDMKTENERLKYELSEVSKRFEPQSFTDLMKEVRQNYENSERVKELEKEVERLKSERGEIRK